MESNLSAVPIELHQLAQFRERADHLLTTVRWTPAEMPKDEARGAGLRWRDSAVGEQQQQELSIIKIARSVSADPLLLSEEINHVLTVLRQALQIGMHVSKIYTTSSGLEQLIAANSRGGLSDAQKGEFRGKYTTASAVAMFSAASYAAWELSRYRTDELNALQLDFAGIPEVSLRDPVRPSTACSSITPNTSTNRAQYARLSISSS